MKKIMYPVERYDDNPENIYTYKTWRTMTSFETEPQAIDFIRRASSPTQLLRLGVRRYEHVYDWSL